MSTQLADIVNLKISKLYKHYYVGITKETFF